MVCVCIPVMASGRKRAAIPVASSYVCMYGRMEGSRRTDAARCHDSKHSKRVQSIKPGRHRMTTEIKKCCPRRRLLLPSELLVGGGGEVVVFYIPFYSSQILRAPADRPPQRRRVFSVGVGTESRRHRRVVGIFPLESAQIVWTLAKKMLRGL